MKRQTLLLVTLSAFLLVGCDYPNTSSYGSDLDSVTSGSGSELPDAPLDQIYLTVDDFAYNEDISVPVIHGLESRGIRTNYTYLDANTEEYIDVYDAGTKNYIEIGTYILKADITCFSYKPFTLTATFSVLIGEMDLSLVAHDYYYDEEVPLPWLYGYPYSAEVTYKYYSNNNPEEKLGFEYRVENTIVPGEYTLEASVTDEHFAPASTTDTFTVFKAEFDDDYELQEDRVDIGQLDTGFKQSDINLDNLLHMKKRYTGEDVSGVHFMFKKNYDFSGEYVKAIVIAQKEYFEDKEYEVEFDFTKTRVSIPHLECVNSEDDIDNLVYDGTEKSVKLVDFDEARSTDVGVLTATEASGYCVTVSLKDSLHTCWEDGTTDDIVLEWAIKQHTFSSFRLKMGDFVGEENEKELRVSYSVLANPLEVVFEYKNDSGVWTPYEYQQIEPYHEGYDTSHYDENGRFVIDDYDQSPYITITSTNRNYNVNVTFHIHPYEVRQAVFTPDSRNPIWNIYPIFIDYYACAYGPDDGDYILEASTEDGYFTFNGTMDRVEFVELTFKSVANMPAFSIKCAFSDYTNPSDSNEYEKTVEVEEGYDGYGIMFDFTDTYEERGNRYFFLKVYFGGEVTQSLQLTRIVVQHIRMV